MAMVLDHPSGPVKDQEAAAAFSTTILGRKGEGRAGHAGQCAVVRVNDALTLEFLAAEAVPSQH
jgi:hypothetical protein